MICRICETECKQFLDLGKQPLANRFVSKDQFKDEEYYPMTVHFCPNCFTVQLGDHPSTKSVFNDEYPFFTGTSKYMEEHFKSLADMIDSRFFEPLRAAGKRPVLIEIGANDGTFLQHFVDRDSEFKRPVHLGFEPSGNVAKVAKSRGVRICSNRFESHDFGNWPETDIIVSSNVFAHIPDRIGLLNNILKILASGGTWINEEPYLGYTIENIAFDQFYNEHIFYTSISSMMRTLSMFDLHIDSFEYIWTHGGSIRYFIKRGAEDTGVGAHIVRSHHNTFETDPETHLMRFGDSVMSRIETLKQIVSETKGQIVGYGAPAKMSTITNSCGFGPDVIKKVYDITPDKIGKFSPGQHIPVVSYDLFKKDNPKNVFLFIWNHANEVMKKEHGKKRNWIIPVINVGRAL